MDANIRLRYLRTFIEVARQGGVGRAAEALHLTQPAVTRTLRELEAAVGVALVEREGRGIRLTPAGQTFLRHAEAGLAAIRQGVDAINPAYGAEAPMLRVGALPTVAARLMPLAIGRFRAAAGRRPLLVTTGDNRLLFDQLRRGQLDLVVGRLAAPEQMAGLSFEYLYSEQVRFVVRTGHPLLALSPFEPAAIARYLVLLPVREAIIRPFVERLLIANGVGDLPERIDTISDSFGRALLRRTDAIWIISEGVVANDLAEGALAALPIDTTDTRGAVGLTLRAGEARSDGLDALGRAIREATGELGL
jgi:LysR family pca operon transcriptional activator